MAFKKTIYEMGLYIIAYLGLVLISPLFLRVGVMYILFVVPLVVKILYEFYRYSRKEIQWLRFFLWINVSLIICLSIPLADKWLFHYLILF